MATALRPSPAGPYLPGYQGESAALRRFAEFPGTLVFGYGGVVVFWFHAGLLSKGIGSFFSLGDFHLSE